MALALEGDVLCEVSYFPVQVHQSFLLTISHSVFLASMSQMYPKNKKDINITENNNSWNLNLTYSSKGCGLRKQTFRE